MVLCADGHRRGWNLNDTIRRNQSGGKKKTDSFISFQFYSVFTCTDAEKRESVFDKSSRTEGSSERARPSRHAVLQSLHTTVHYRVTTGKERSLISKVNLCDRQSTFKEKYICRDLELEAAQRVWSKVSIIQNTAWRLHEPLLLCSVKMYYQEEPSKEIYGNKSQLGCKHRNDFSHVVIVSCNYCISCQMELHEN